MTDTALQPAKNHAATLPGLPTETILEIQSYLGYASQIALQSTCRALYARVDDPNQPESCIMSTSKAYNMKDLLELELWPDFDGSFACGLCLRIRPTLHFSNIMLSGRFQKQHPREAERYGGVGAVPRNVDRFCLACGIERGKYPRGTTVRFGGAQGGYGLLCRSPTCGVFERVEGGVDGGSRTQGYCAACAGVQPSWRRTRNAFSR